MKMATPVAMKMKFQVGQEVRINTFLVPRSEFDIYNRRVGRINSFWGGSYCVRLQSGLFFEDANVPEFMLESVTEAQPEGEPDMTTSTNFTTAIFLYNDAVRALRTIYQPDEPGKTPIRRELAKTLDPSIKIGDIVIVPSGTRHGFTTVKVVEVDVDFDIETSEQIKWVAAKFDPADFQKTLAWEEKNNETIRSAQRTAKRAELAAKIKADNPALAQTMNAITHQPDDAKDETGPAPGASS